MKSAAVVWLGLAGCYVGVGDGDGAAAGWLDLPPGAGSADGGDDGDGDDGDGDGDGEDEEPTTGHLGCSEAGPASVGATPLRRLTRDEYDATVLDLLGDDSAPARNFVADEQQLGFDTNPTAPSKLAADQYRQAAKTLAATARAERFDEWMPCDRGSTQCVGPFVDWLGRRAYRRPLTAAERADYLDLYEEAKVQWGAETSVELVVQVMLMSPHFLYHVETGTGDGAGPRQLTSWEVASRLSYFLWGTMPDDALLDAAAAGVLATKEGVAQQAERLLADARSRGRIESFAAQWIGLRELDAVERDPALFPEWDSALLEPMRHETESFFSRVIFEEDARLGTLLTASHSWPEAALAEHYGVTVDAEGRAELPAAERAGFLTQAAFLVGHAYPTENSWVHRGKFVRERLLCDSMPPPPDDIDFEQPNDPNRMENPECSGCHVLMDPIGQGFDDYDPTGTFVGLGGGGTVHGSPVGDFDSIPQMAAGLADDDGVQTCFAETLGFFALGRVLGDSDECAREAILKAFAESGGDVQALMLAIATSDAFRHVKGA